MHGAVHQHGSPLAQHGGLDPELGGDLHLRPATALEKGDRLAFELGGELASCLRHQTPSPPVTSVSEVSAKPREDQCSRPHGARLRSACSAAHRPCDTTYRTSRRRNGPIPVGRGKTLAVGPHSRLFARALCPRLRAAVPLHGPDLITPPRRPARVGGDYRKARRRVNPALEDSDITAGNTGRPAPTPVHRMAVRLESARRAAVIAWSRPG
ncbi:hypothetical protein Maq22A_c28035 [Methylobacterium aquaticum]|uniref:Uncharacterized protein n=1 Tax=Methylobacterium aquaticum TaxID=270351 RepID=A0A1Y0ZFK9_9HYPH|nr:hypothetical protein Maq22A_c28035 [Methylobacterium aquaticum]